MKMLLTALLFCFLLGPFGIVAESEIQDVRSNKHFDFKLFKEIQLPSFPNITVPVFKSSGTKGPGILMVHGISSSSRSFVFQLLSLLGLERQIFLVDLPGFGRAGKVDPSLPFPVDDQGIPAGFPEYQSGLVEAVSVVGNDAEVTAEVFVGWSLGGNILLLAQGAGLLPNMKGLFIFSTAPTGSNPPTTEAPFLPPNVPNFPFDLSILTSFGFSFQLDETSPLGFSFNGVFTDPVPAYAPPPISDAPDIGAAYIRAFFNETRRIDGDVPEFFLKDGFDRSDSRARGSIGVIAFGLLPGSGLPDELEVLKGLEGNPNDPTDDIPIAVVVGKEDAFVNPNYLMDLNDEGAIPTLWKNKIIRVRNAGHAIHFERPLRFNLLLRDFIHSLGN